MGNGQNINKPRFNFEVDNSKSSLIINPINYFDSLDGLRFIAALSVVLFHKINNTDWLFYEEYPWFYRCFSFVFRNGFIGVNFFFVLSGFLITYLIHREIYHSGEFNFYKFIVRRILRIWPLFFLVVFVGFWSKGNLDGLPYYLTFLSNIEVIHHNSIQTGILFPLWSVSIEEQYYFLIPLVIYVIKIKKPYSFLILYFVLLLISISYQIINGNDLEKLHYAFLSCITDLSIGGITATLAFYSKDFVKKLTLLQSKCIFLVYVFGMGYIVIRVYLQDFLLIHALERFFLAIFFSFIILEQTYSKNSFYKISTHPFINKSGQYTYAIYMFHMIFLTWLHELWIRLNFYDNVYVDLLLKTILVIVITYFVSKLSAKYYEGPFLKLKKYFQ